MSNTFIAIAIHSWTWHCNCIVLVIPHFAHRQCFMRLWPGVCIDQYQYWYPVSCTLHMPHCSRHRPPLSAAQLWTMWAQGESCRNSRQEVATSLPVAYTIHTVTSSALPRCIQIDTASKFSLALDMLHVPPRRFFMWGSKHEDVGEHWTWTRISIHPAEAAGLLLHC